MSSARAHRLVALCISVAAFILFLVAPYIVVPYGLVGAYGMLAALTVLAFPFIALLHWPRIDAIQSSTMSAPNVSFCPSRIAYMFIAGSDHR